MNIFRKKLKGLQATSPFRIQNDDSIICGYFCIRFIDSMLKGNPKFDFMLEYTNYFHLMKTKRMIK